ncbi:MAG: class I SAM-dependent methyltransferase [Planctomycetota bacterium]|nr:MAG: class I SAM-dependent methyltransferase [Planctomycetota bacterium]
MTVSAQEQGRTDALGAAQRRPWSIPLRCPHCLGELTSLTDALRAGAKAAAASCSCSGHCVVEGVVCLGQDERRSAGSGGVGEHVAAEALAPHLRTLAGRLVQLAYRLERPAPRAVQAWAQRQALQLLRRADGLAYRDAVGALRNARYGAYLLQRWANPSFQAAAPLVARIAVEARRRLAQGRPFRVLDLAGGAGHAGTLLSVMAPGVEVALADADFANLWLASRYAAQPLLLLRMNAVAPWPFEDDAFDAILCVDALHYMLEKPHVVAEARRCLRPQGAAVFAHLHNRLQPNPSPGWPVDPQGWRRIFSSDLLWLGDERDIARRYSQEGLVDLQAPDSPLEQAQALTAVVSDSDAWRSPRRVDECFLDAAVHAGAEPNAVYADARNAPDGLCRLRKRWAHPVYERECAAGDQLPETFELRCAELEALERGDRALLGAHLDWLRRFLVTPRLHRRFQQERRCA